MATARLYLIALAALVAVSSPAAASDLEPPAGNVILTVEGAITHTNAKHGAEFDRAMLEALGSATIRTSTPWHNDIVSFEGAPAQKLLDAVGATGKTARILALNDYQVDVPTEDFARFPTIFALKADGEYLTVPTKGPVFLVYDYDSDPDLATERYFARSVWQIRKITILD